jgi:methyltransferase
MLIRILVCGFMALARLLELVHSQRNLAAQGPVAEGELSRRSFPLIVALHTGVIVATALRGGRVRTGWLLALAALQPLRVWVLITLGHRWSARGAVAEQLSVATDGPYRYIRHPNYAVVLGELVFLPLAFGLKRVSIVGLIANSALLTIRIRDEERLLLQRPGYEEHFGDKPRLLPGIL